MAHTCLTRCASWSISLTTNRTSAPAGTSVSSVNQSSYFDAWVDIGTYDFDAGDTRRVRLDDATGEAAGSTRVNCDAVRFQPT